jgi:hypothetical protein
VTPETIEVEQGAPSVGVLVAGTVCDPFGSTSSKPLSNASPIPTTTEHPGPAHFGLHCPRVSELRIVEMSPSVCEADWGRFAEGGGGLRA